MGVDDFHPGQTRRIDKQDFQDIRRWHRAAALRAKQAGFDIIYALQDEAFDRRTGLHSLPVRLGPRRALLTARCFHLTALLLLVTTGWMAPLGPFYATALAAGGSRNVEYMEGKHAWIRRTIRRALAHYDMPDPRATDGGLQ